MKTGKFVVSLFMSGFIDNESSTMNKMSMSRLTVSWKEAVSTRVGVDTGASRRLALQAHTTGNAASSAAQRATLQVRSSGAANNNLRRIWVLLRGPGLSAIGRAQDANWFRESNDFDRQGSPVPGATPMGDCPGVGSVNPRQVKTNIAATTSRLAATTSGGRSLRRCGLPQRLQMPPRRAAAPQLPHLVGLMTSHQGIGGAPLSLESGP
jgi:hypothetical protein